MSRLGGAGRGLTRLTRAKNVPSFTSRTSCKATNRVFMPLQALQSSKTGFLCHCRRCNRPKPGFYAIADVAIVQNRVLAPLQALQSLRIRFWRICMVCNGSESDSGRIARSAMAQNQILGCPAHKPRAGDECPPRFVGAGRCDSCRSRSRQTKNLGEKRVGTVSRMKG